jgi:hypothetical protein
MLNDLANKFAQTPAPPKDPEAEEFIRTRIGSRPDALYLMTQTVLIQNIALQQAQQQIQQLQRSPGAGAAGPGGSFLGQGQGQSRGGGYSQSGGQGAPPPQYSALVQSTPMPAAGSAPSFLRGAAQTAAGVAAGALAFEGIRSLFSHPGYGMGGLGGGFMGGAPVEETVVNNYYDNASDSGRDDYRDDRGNDFVDTDSNDAGQYDDSAQFDDTGDAGGFDDSGDNFA